MNRQLTSRIAAWHFAPTPLARENLIKENIDESHILVTGNTVIDALRMILKRINESPEMEAELRSQIAVKGYPVERLDSGRRLVLITGHRRENFGEGFRSICRAIKELSVTFQDIDFLYPVHFNPNVRDVVNQVLGAADLPNLFLTDPLDYLPFVYLMQKCFLVLTDSGGIQEEAPDLRKPVLVMRDTTERPEAVEAGTVELVGTGFDSIVGSVTRLISDSKHYSDMISRKNPFGDGLAAERIFNFISAKNFRF
jgi:UDP-N-acetylglucosamine 2-epimerase (non-hydrolysing)